MHHRLLWRTVQAGASATLVAACLMVGVSSAGASAGVVVREPHYGFTFTLPVGWKSVPLNGSDITTLLNAATHDDPTLTNSVTSEVKSAVSKGTKVFAIGPVSGTTLPNANIIVSSATGTPSGNGFAPAAVAEAKIEFAQVGAKHVHAAIVSNHLGRTAVVTYVLNLTASQHVYGEQVYARHGSEVYIVTATTSSTAGSQAAMKAMVNSWHW